MEKIQEGIGGLPDLLSFIIALDERLKELEKTVADFISNPGNGPVSPVGPVLSPVPPEVTPEPIEEPSITISTTSIPLQSETEEPAPPEVTPGPTEEPSIDISTTSTPLQSDETDEQTSTRTRRITLTMTSRITTTQQLASVTSAVDETSYPAVNTTDFEPPAPWTKPYHLTTSAEDWTVTYTFAEETNPSLETGISTSIETPATLSTSFLSTPSPTPSSYTFDASSEDNVAVYYGTTPKTEIGGLASLCANPNVDIVILSFLFAFFDANGLPSIDFGPGCTDPTPTQANLAPGLKDCTALAQEITTCQSIGKKVLLSLGGYNSNASFTSSQQASDFASMLWDLFGAGNGSEATSALRPFGPDVRVDGFDIDNENHRTYHYETFTTALRAKLDSDSSKTYYLSAAPQCPIPDESIPLGALLQADFVFVQFYNNPGCNLDSAGFQESFRRWSSLLGEGTANAPRPRLYVGAAGFEGAGTGYVKGSGLGTRVRTARELYVDNLGGVMLWDGSEAGANLDQYGVSYLEYAKAALH